MYTADPAYNAYVLQDDEDTLAQQEEEELKEMGVNKEKATKEVRRALFACLAEIWLVDDQTSTASSQSTPQLVIGSLLFACT